MASSIDYEQLYQQAYKAYVHKDYQNAATLIEQVVDHLSEDPNARLLKGHVYYVLQKYDIAQVEYKAVLNLTDDQEILGFARNGLESINNYQSQLVQSDEIDNESKGTDLSDSLSAENKPVENSLLYASSDSDSKNLIFSTANDLGNEDGTVLLNEGSLKSPFDIGTDSEAFDSIPNFEEEAGDNPFTKSSDLEADIHEQNGETSISEPELPSFWQHNTSEANSEKLDQKDPDFSNLEIDGNSQQNPFTETELPLSNNLEDSQISFEDNPVSESESFSLPSNFFEDEFTVDDTEVKVSSSEVSNLKDDSSNNFSHASSIQQDFSQLKSPELQESTAFKQDLENDSFDLEAFEEVFGSDNFSEKNEDTKSIAQVSSSSSSSSNIEYLDEFDEFDEFDDLGSISEFDLSRGNPTFSDVIPPSGSLQTNGALSGNNNIISSPSENNRDIPNHEFGDNVESDDPHTGERDAELFSITNSQEAVPVFTQNENNKVEPQVNVDRGVFAALENAPLQTKQWLTAGMVGVVSSVVVAVISFAATSLSPPQQRESIRNTGWAMALAAGISGFATTGAMGHFTFKQVRRTTKDLQTQFDSVRQGNLSAQATVYSEDEFGQLAASFNEMARVIFTTTHEATRKAQEQEEAKENLQRQVIRLLDDVEGAARGDLTVQAEVTADVLGAVADAFNLTIQNLRDIVQQVKVAAREVTKGATNSETFARALSSDALRQAEELAVTLNSVQVMTDSIQRVAEAATEAEAVARDASEIALKGGDAVENTVAGILEIRETVAETTRKVKRLAESSQEISKIVALISQIASRTNLLALNASIEAARAGESGRGFAIVADEVRQLADKSAKSLKEIEQIVMQIQSETGSVMTAMEEGTQQVIKGTKLAEEAKRSLENIIQVANRIEILVSSITTDTVEQTDTSRAVAQVMQSVELTAQETSQEAQRVSGALQHLVGVSRNLISSVERFRVETAESR